MQLLVQSLSTCPLLAEAIIIPIEWKRQVPCLLWLPFSDLALVYHVGLVMWDLSPWDWCQGTIRAVCWPVVM